MSQAHCGVRGVDGLTAGARRAVDVDADVVHVEFEVLDLLGLRVHEHAGSGGVNAALRLGRGHALDAVDAALVLEVRPHAVLGLHGTLGLHGHGDVLVAAHVRLGGLEDLGLPALGLGVLQVHLQQVAREQRGLLATLARLDLQDHVAGIVRVARDEDAAESLRRALGCLLQGRHLGRKLGVGIGHLPSGGEVILGGLPGPMRGDDAAEAPRTDGPACAISRHPHGWQGRRATLNVGILVQQRLDGCEGFGHVVVGKASGYFWLP
ncbi:hypothetical protein GCM10025876_28630 [Demequina litorisediminis]|uniref:Uncharacterized protein n=1 Tax=Demequina litorisediminis TaxID=1849022 RepID=A0ABQ6IIY1_9MICO|nr:hypothetical protein GCM10025876_28630 [Demequina litorisediminis]